MPGTTILTNNHHDQSSSRMPYRELNTPQPLRAVMRNHTTSGVETHREIIKRRRTRRASYRSTRRSAFENLQVTDLRASPCVSRFAAFFIGTRAETSTAESDTLSNCCVRHSTQTRGFGHHRCRPRPNSRTLSYLLAKC